MPVPHARQPIRSRPIRRKQRSCRFFAHIRPHSGHAVYDELRRDLARSIILGLEFLIAGEIIRTATLSQTLESVGLLVTIVLMRTF
ncbi:MAG: DUF1622 domain-containing protein, partial [Gemmatimonadetes bacterium]|nr:DUF1622 domain-containing protein [Gemmatimonadota bacterium]